MSTNCEGLKIQISKQKQLDELKINAMREKAVNFLFRNFEYGSEWLKIEGIKMLFFYRDMPNIIERLNSYFYGTDSTNIKQAIAEFVDGTLNVDDLLEKRRRYEQTQEELRLMKLELIRESETSISKSESSGTFGVLGLSSLKVSDLS